MKNDFIIIGAGLSGLNAALKLEEKGLRGLILEESAQIGGKVKTDLFEDTYLLDHGFQVLLPSYSELKKYNPLLDLQYFKSGAILNTPQGQFKVADPFENPFLILETLTGNYGSIKDKLLTLKLKYSVLFKSDESLIHSEQESSYEFLKKFGFSETMIQNFWKPFFSGIFLESELRTQAGFLKFLYKMFASSPVAVPRKGIQELPKTMVSQLKNTEIILNTRVENFDSHTVQTSKNKFEASKVISTIPNAETWGSVTTLYFSAPETPIDGPWLFLNSKPGLINHVAVMTEVSKDYSQNKDALISVNVIKPYLDSSEFQKIKTELNDLFGPSVKHWKFLSSYEIPKALPLYLKSSGLMNTPSQQGALLKGSFLSQ